MTAACGGISGAMRALKASSRAGEIVTVGHQLMENTRDGLLDGTLAMILDDPMEVIAHETLRGMLRACQMPEDRGKHTVILPFDICTRENI